MGGNFMMKKCAVSLRQNLKKNGKNSKKKVSGVLRREHLCVNYQTHVCRKIVFGEISLMLSSLIEGNSCCLTMMNVDIVKQMESVI